MDTPDVTRKDLVMPYGSASNPGLGAVRSIVDRKDMIRNRS